MYDSVLRCCVIDAFTSFLCTVQQHIILRLEYAGIAVFVSQYKLPRICISPSRWHECDMHQCELQIKWTTVCKKLYVTSGSKPCFIFEISCSLALKFFRSVVIHFLSCRHQHTHRKRTSRLLHFQLRNILRVQRKENICEAKITAVRSHIAWQTTALYLPERVEGSSSKNRALFFWFSLIRCSSLALA